MASESRDRRSILVHDTVVLGPQAPPKLSSVQPVPCPRCQSINTKFCYYNNNKLSQPRHFCRSCRRYWTKGGALRNVPFGGGTRKKSKRSCSSSSSNTSVTKLSSSSSTVSTSTFTHDSESLRSSLPINSPDKCLTTAKMTTHVSNDFNLNDNLPVMTENGSFCEFLGLGGYAPSGFGFGFGFCEMGLSYGGRGAWPYQGVSFDGGSDDEGLFGGAPGYNSKWQLLGDVHQTGSGASDHRLGNGDGNSFSWPGFAFSPLGTTLK